ncbi:neuronal acetylcholine receptor subunit alpha-9-like [Convolutriloba macropyga]|uniref:neuronal acetylcholine receptor subunit alpha-9-like n=1 Tax=Convolutriloba macropyga TaxID=536237 RepID=UPI003F5257A0
MGSDGQASCLRARQTGSAFEQVTNIIYDGFNRQAVYSNGWVFAWSSLATVQLSCQFDVAKFPYDSQTCQIRLAPFLLNNLDYKLGLEDEHLLNRKTQQREMPLYDYVQNDQWILETPVILTLGTVGWHDEKFDQVQITVRLQRRSNFYQVAIITPFTLLYIISGFAFLIPVECGEKISFAITTMLAQMVNFGVLLQILPASSLNVPEAFISMRNAFCHLSLNCLGTIVVVNVHTIGSERKLWSWICWVLSSKFVYALGLKKIQQTKLANTGSSCTKAAKIDTDGGHIQQDKMEDQTEKNSASSVNNNDFEERSLEWIYLARFLDRFFFIIHCFLCIYLINHLARFSEE